VEPGAPPPHPGTPAGASASPAVPPHDVLAQPPDARDISAELSAPPRRRLPWPTLALSAAVVAVLAFTGGVLVGKDRPSASPRTGDGAFARGGAFTAGGTGGRAFGGPRGTTGTGTAGAGGTATGGAGGGRPGGGAFGAGLTIGTVKLVDGTTVYVTDTQGDIVKITTKKTTRVSEATTGKVSDLQPGQTVTVRGSRDPSGDIAATTVTEGAAGGFGGTGGLGGTGG
jgi:hypothetical protein